MVTLFLNSILICLISRVDAAGKFCPLKTLNLSLDG